MSWFLRPLQPLYKLPMQRRRAALLNKRKAEALPCPILSVGNLTTGGTGKTPTVQWAARFLERQGYKVGIASRGYGGTASEAGALVSDGQTIFLSASEAGDEPLLHARSLPQAIVAIAKNRHHAVDLAVKAGAEVVILDDGFQFWSLPRNFELVLLDACRPFGNGFLLPAGRLREEPGALERADAILLTRADRATSKELEATYQAIQRWTKAPIFEAWHAPIDLRDEKTEEIQPLSLLKDRNLRAFAGLESNDQFYQTLSQLGAGSVETLVAEKGDHHHWKAQDFRWKYEDSGGKSDSLTITTEKDAVKIDPSWFDGPILSLRIALQIRGDETALQHLILGKLRNVA